MMPVVGKPPMATTQVLSSNLAIAILLTAALLDFCVGDPWGWPHPVRLIGWCISYYTKVVFDWVSSPIGQYIAGACLGIGLPLGIVFLSMFIITVSKTLSLLLSFSIATVLMASCWAAKSLRSAAEEVIYLLENRGLDAARKQLKYYVGRDTTELSKTEILRALLESISENATDGVFAPLFYSLLGLFISPEWGVSAALAYKGLSTLDSMVGYRTSPYQHLGCVSARLEDVATWLPCRVTVLTIAIMSGSFKQVLTICQRDASTDPSPNSGWSECAYAAALNIQLGGLNYYQGEPKYKPLLGDCLESITTSKIEQALHLTRYGVLMWLSLGVGGLIFRYHIHCG